VSLVTSPTTETTPWHVDRATLVALARYGGFREVALLVASGSSFDDATGRCMQARCQLGPRLMDLDAEDFDQTTFIPDPLVSLHQSSS